jgi:hypothetical protein
MSALISALDNYTPSQLGEKGSTEYTWSNSVRERILQLSFQLTRIKKNKNNEHFACESDVMNNLAKQTSQILNDLFTAYYSKGEGEREKEECLMYLSMMYRMIGHTRDIVGGKGECELSYMLLNVWNIQCPELAQYAFRLFVHPPPSSSSSSSSSSLHPFGSWKDIKYVYHQANTTNSSLASLANYGMHLLIDQLKLDEQSETPSLAAKWAPREKSKFGKSMFDAMALFYFGHYLESAKTPDACAKAVLKARMNFRKLIASLNRKLDTVQIKQCGQQWAEIEPSKQTSITMHKQKRAFLNVKKDGTLRNEVPDRIACANKFKEFTAKAVRGEVEIKGQRIGLHHFTQSALELSKRRTSDEAAILNAQWVNNAKQTGALGNMVAMVDVSGSMMGDPMHVAIALGIRVAEKSRLGKRVITFSTKPSWVDLSGQATFVDMVDTLRRADWGGSTNFEAAMDMILNAIVQQRLTHEDIQGLVLAIFSDMQMDQADRNYVNLMARIAHKYAQTGMKLWGKPFAPPHILFWNLRSTSGFPTLSSQPNASMMSGFSPALLNLFCDQGLEALQHCTPWSMLQTSLDNERYASLDTHLRTYLSRVAELKQHK